MRCRCDMRITWHRIFFKQYNLQFCIAHDVDIIKVKGKKIIKIKQRRKKKMMHKERKVYSDSQRINIDIARTGFDITAIRYWHLSDRE